MKRAMHPVCSREHGAFRHPRPADPRAAHAAELDALVRALSASMDRTIASVIARFHGSVCAAASDECQGPTVDFAGTELMCAIHIRVCIQCGRDVCPGCYGRVPHMMQILGGDARTPMWACQRHIVPCSPVCMPALGWNACSQCGRGMCMFHVMETALRDRTGNFGTCHECMRKCTACRRPLHRQCWRPDTESEAYRASMCGGCYERACGERALKQLKGE